MKNEASIAVEAVKDWDLTLSRASQAQLEPDFPAYCSFADSALACFRMGISRSASFHRVKKS
jgi:hypothetical protein